MGVAASTCGSKGRTVRGSARVRDVGSGRAQSRPDRLGSPITGADAFQHGTPRSGGLTDLFVDRPRMSHPNRRGLVGDPSGEAAEVVCGGVDGGHRVGGSQIEFLHLAGRQRQDHVEQRVIGHAPKATGHHCCLNMERQEIGSSNIEEIRLTDVAYSDLRPVTARVTSIGRGRV